jgi:hypothetical protein
MKKTYITFGQDHCHRVNDITFDKDCVAVIKHKEAGEGRKLAFEIFGKKFCFSYEDEEFNHQSLKNFFPRGLIEIN